MRTPKQGSNPILDFALTHEFDEFKIERGTKRVVAFGDESHKCPTYVLRTPPCQAGCPAGEDIRGYHNLLTGVEKSDDIWDAAWRRVTERNPFPSVMGRVCPHPCETSCNREIQDEAIGINMVEHAIGDFGIENDLQYNKPTTETGKRIAVIGGGPAGLSAAYQMRLRGHEVTIYDYREKLGGMMRYGILEYRVSREALDAEISKIINLGGIHTKMNTRIGTDVTLEELKEKYDAVFIGVGAQKGNGLPVHGFGDSPNTTNAIDFLEDFELNGDKMHVGQNVVVIGDGDVSMDAVRLSRRMGSKATLLSAVPRDEMNCSDMEYDDAAREGVDMKELISVVGVIRDGETVKGAKCVKMVKKDQGEEGFNSPIPFLRYKPVEGSDFEIECDMIVAAIGQRTNMEGLESATGDNPFLKVDKTYKLQGEEKVFGGGDAIKIDLITTAVGHGRKAAEAMHQYIMAIPADKTRPQEVIPYEKLYTYYFKESEQIKRPHAEIPEIKGNFDETLKSTDRETAIAESKRCMSCGLCFECKQCMLYCPQEAITMRKQNPIGEVMYTDYSKCVGCHICAQVCPTGYIHMGMGEDL